MPRYARNGDVSLAYEVIGDGERDILLTLGWIGSFQSALDHPPHARWLRRLAALGRVIVWDKRGTGLSERLPPNRLPTLEERMDDMRVVLDAAGSERAVVFGISEGVSLSAVFAASHPDRVSALILFGGFARITADDGYEWGEQKAVADEFNRRMEETWGDNAGVLKLWAPSVADDPVERAHWNRMLTTGGTPATAIAWLQMVQETDVRATLPAIQVPTLVLHREGDIIMRVEHGRYLAREIPGARYVELPGADHLNWVDGDDILDEVESFLTGTTVRDEPDRVLATVMFTDIVDSTTRAAELGDRRWRDLVEAHDRIVRSHLEGYRGREVKTLGDGFLATFDGPGRAIRCAGEVRDAVRAVGLELRAGLHTGEVEVAGADISGITVNIGARVGAKAQPGEVLVSQTVKDLVAGSGFRFDDRGQHALKGVPGEWRLWAVD
ncbi:MAG TPA: adenylate/guanylate cyclase domain-containing protein [Thermoleophilaceae bacterium]|jgi:class 3 adenylate cyclase